MSAQNKMGEWISIREKQSPQQLNYRIHVTVRDALRFLDRFPAKLYRRQTAEDTLENTLEQLRGDHITVSMLRWLMQENEYPTGRTEALKWIRQRREAHEQEAEWGGVESPTSTTSTIAHTGKPKSFKRGVSRSKSRSVKRSRSRSKKSPVRTDTMPPEGYPASRSRSASRKRSRSASRKRSKSRTSFKRRSRTLSYQ